jgi:hypothetical protein
VLHSQTYAILSGFVFAARITPPASHGYHVVPAKPGQLDANELAFAFAPTGDPNLPIAKLSSRFHARALEVPLGRPGWLLASEEPKRSIDLFGNSELPSFASVGSRLNGKLFKNASRSSASISVRRPHFRALSMPDLRAV